MMRIGETASAVGRHRFTVLMSLLALNVALGAFWQYWLTPQYDAMKIERDSADNERLRLKREITDLPSKYDALKKSEARYVGMISQGFIGEQDRIVARQRLDTLRAASGLRGIDYNILPQAKTDIAQTYTPLNNDLMKSEVKVGFKSLTDVEIRDFIEQMHTGFSGLATLKSMKLIRLADVDEASLAKLGQREPMDFIGGEASFDWYSLVPKKVDPNAAATQAFGGASK